MADKKCVNVLCEDKQHATFIRKFFKKKGWKVPNVKPLQNGSGSGEQHVREQYPDELDAARKKDGILVVMIDGDAVGVDKRLQELDNACRRRTPSIDVRTSNDKVAIFVPVRSIETWFAFLDKGSDVCESKKYPKLEKERECKIHVNKLFDMCRKQQKLPENAPSSLRRAYEEWKRIV